MANEFGITLDDAVAELQHEVKRAIDFMWSEFEADWDKAERYYAGECDLPTDEGRSDAVKTEVRDVIRALTPNIMRILYQAKKPVEYIPTHISHAALIAQQALYVEQLFKASGGYSILHNSVQQAAKLKIGPIKTWFEEEPTPEFIKYTGLTAQEVEELKGLPDFEVTEIEAYYVNVNNGRTDEGAERMVYEKTPEDENEPQSSPNQGDIELFEVEGYKYHTNGKICVEDFPVYEFFVSRNATSLETAKVHGHHRAITVGDAIAMGLEYDDWIELVGTDPEVKQASGQSKARRGYSPDESDTDSADITQQEILLTEVYCTFDLNGDGAEEKYCFYLGGTQFKYITHHEIEDYCIDVVCLDPQPYTVVGRSVADITVEMQDIESSILRAIIDNAHMANNPRLAGDPNYVDFTDVMNNVVGAPIKTRGAPNVQVIDVPFTGQTLMPFLEYLEKDTEQRVGVTKAAQGLDPDALQSTDKDAVRNTIALSQGQVELMARNVVETGLIGVFKKLLRLSIRHMDRMQIIRTKGEVIPVDVRMFNPDLAAEPNVGLGTAGHEEKIATLNFILQKQEQIIGQFGMDNPFTSLSQIYNTLEDITELGGLRDPGRYFRVVTPDMEKKIAEAKAQEQAKMAEQAASQQPMDPSKALLQAEQIKAKIKELELMTKARKEELQLQLDATQAAEKLDIERDKMVQDRVIELRRLGEDRLNTLIEGKQAANDAERVDANADRTGTETDGAGGTETGT